VDLVVTGKHVSDVVRFKRHPILGERRKPRVAKRTCRNGRGARNDCSVLQGDNYASTEAELARGPVANQYVNQVDHHYIALQISWNRFRRYELDNKSLIVHLKFPRIRHR
jgi:hypothetical protein